MASDVDALVRSEVCARVAMFKSRPRNFPPRRHASAYVLTTIVAGLTARYMHQDEPLQPWMMFIDYGIIMAVCVLVLEVCMYFKLLEAVQGPYRPGDLSNVMTWLAVMLGASGFVAQLIQRGVNEDPVIVLLLRGVGVELVFGVMMGSIALIVFGGKLRKRA